MPHNHRGRTGCAAGQDYKTWNEYGGGPDSSYFVDLKQINKSNVNQLEVTWVYPTGDNAKEIWTHETPSGHTRHFVLGEQGPQRPAADLRGQ